MDGSLYPSQTLLLLNHHSIDHPLLQNITFIIHLFLLASTLD
jgi:hypothetical protein